MSWFGSHPGVRNTIAIVLLVALLLAGSALASATHPPGGVAATGRVIGQTGFAYLGGLRTFAAAVLWNRLDPQFDEYYNTGFDKNFAVFLPTIHLVLALDPQFEQGYYITSYWLERTGRTSEAFQLAREGLAKNPTSGLLTANLAQLLFIHSKEASKAEMLSLATRGVSQKVTWANTNDQFEGYGIFKAVFHTFGYTDAALAVGRVQEVLRANGAAPGVSIDATSLPAPTRLK